MEQLVFLSVLRIIISITGVVGNTVLILSILHMTRLKTFEVFLLGLAVSNLEDIVIVDIYDLIVIRSTHSISIWLCSTLKFLTISGDVAGILFTVLISIFRYQKLHNAAHRVITPIFMDSKAAAVALSVGCVLVALLLSMPTYFINRDTWHHMNNLTAADCPADFFQCPKGQCPTLINIYKYVFIIICHLMPLVIVTGTSSLIIKILIVQQNVVKSHHDLEPATIAAHQHHHHHESSVFHRSTIGILAAMTLFQIHCCLFLTLRLVINSNYFPLWSEMKFFVSTIYTAAIPYIYGMGHNFFSLKHFMKQ